MRTHVTILEGNPEPEITWLKDGQVLPQFTNSTHVTIPVSKDDTAAAAGEYTGNATNEAGMDEAHTQMQLGTGIYICDRLFTYACMYSQASLVSTPGNPPIATN